MKKNIRESESESKASIDKRLKIYSKDTLSGIVKAYLNGSTKISPYEAKMCFYLFSQDLMTEQAAVNFWKKKGFALFKINPTNKKLRTLYKIQKLTSVESIG